MKRFLELLVLGVMIFISYGVFSQQIGVGENVRLSIDPVVLVNESNYNLKLEFDSGVYGDSAHRVIVTTEILTGHAYLGASIGYGYIIPYWIGNVEFQIEPSFELGIIYRWEWEVGFGTNHSWNLRHQMKISDKFSLFIHNRVILRSDLHYQNEMSNTPENIPFYNIDNAVGIAFYLN
jgi:hypothetical protein